MRLHDLLDGSRGDILELSGSADVDVRSVVHDSRDVSPGACFACIRGAITDGHLHAADAVGAGAVALLVEEELSLPVPQARVQSVRCSLGPIAARFHGDPSRAMTVLGVTGTNGKTTVTYLLEAIARAAGRVSGVIGTIQTRIAAEVLPPGRTTPEATDLQALFARMRAAGVDVVAMEVSSHALAQHRVDGTAFAAVCFTNLSHDHLDYHGSMDAYFAAKARLFDGSFASAAAIAMDDPYGRTLAAQLSARGGGVWTFSVSDAEADVHAIDIELGAAATSFVLVSRRDGWRSAVRTGLVGPFNVANALAAAATARAAGVPRDAIVGGLAAPIVVPGRFERVTTGNEFVVVVDYAHTPDALERVLGAARALAGASARVIAVYGAGGDRDRAKRPLMGAAVARGADQAYLTSDNPRSEDPAAIAADVLAGAPPERAPTVELDRRLAIRAALADARAGDVVVIAGKGHETGQTALGVTRPFDDRAVAREELEALACP
ncbi:MAG: UDP-N-acetylmuramoyl-L-alanyl-D-glutamate--2,6-diaminopimelate ligase [Actinomycetota bacterium]